MPFVDELWGVSCQVVEHIEGVALQLVGKFLSFDPLLEVAPSAHLVSHLITFRIIMDVNFVLCNWALQKIRDYKWVLLLGIGNESKRTQKCIM